MFLTLICFVALFCFVLLLSNTFNLIKAKALIFDTFVLYYEDFYFEMNYNCKELCKRI